MISITILLLFDKKHHFLVNKKSEDYYYPSVSAKLREAIDINFHNQHLFHNRIVYFDTKVTDEMQIILLKNAELPTIPVINSK